MKKYNCEIDDYKEFADEGQWRSYLLQAEGDNLQELLESCYVFEIDQDGGELNGYQHLGTEELKAITLWFENAKRDFNQSLTALMEEKEQALYSLNSSLKSEEYQRVARFATRLQEIDQEIENIKIELKKG